MPHNPSTVAAKSIDGKVLVMNTKTNQAQSLMGLTSGGGGLDWSDMDEHVDQVIIVSVFGRLSLLSLSSFLTIILVTSL